MAHERYGFFDSTENDPREYVEADMSEYGKLLAGGDGVKTLEDNLKIASANDGLRTQVGFGSALIQGYWYVLEDDGGGILKLQHEAAESQPRIDRVVLRLDLQTDVRRPVLAVLRGTAAASPIPPTPTRNGTIWELSLAQVRVAVGAVLLHESDITDERENAAMCGAMDAPLRAAKEAQSTADAAKSAASAAQTTADTAKANAAAAQAKADAALPAAAYNAADVLAKLKAVDGVGSGMDADKFKGQDVIPVTSGGTGATTAAGALQLIAPQILYQAATPGAGAYVGQLWLKPV